MHDRTADPAPQPAPAAKACAGDFVTVVSGLPRSGTSMLMRSLEAGGMAVLTDAIRTADPDNPRGYYEYERVKTLPEEAEWLHEARGRAVKIIYKLAYHLPPGLPCKIVFLQRDLAEVVASQEKMLARRGAPTGQIPAETMIRLFQSEVLAFRNWVQGQRHLDILFVDYAGLIDRPEAGMRAVAEFLGLPLDVAAMARVTDPALHRNRA